MHLDAVSQLVLPADVDGPTLTYGLVTITGMIPIVLSVQEISQQASLAQLQACLETKIAQARQAVRERLWQGR